MLWLQVPAPDEAEEMEKLCEEAASWVSTMADKHTCFALGCKARTEESTSLHFLPKDPKIRKQWMTILVILFLLLSANEMQQSLLSHEISTRACVHMS